MNMCQSWLYSPFPLRDWSAQVRAYEAALGGSCARAGLLHPRSVLLLETLSHLCDRHQTVLKDGALRSAKYHRLLQEVYH